MLVVMLSAPFKGLTKKELSDQIVDLKLVSQMLWRMGIACICPHLNTYGFDDDPRENYLQGYEEIARRSDAVLALWGLSEGVLRELAAAKNAFVRLTTFLDWVDKIK